MDRHRVSPGDGRSYHCTLTFVRWLPIFNFGPAYLQIAADALTFARANKGLILRAYVLMPDHMHLIVKHNDIPAVLRTFKTWTSRQIGNQLIKDNRLDAVRIAGEAGVGDPDQQRSIWQAGYHPKAITSDAMMLQKLRYLHLNPVRKGYVSDPAAWQYSSAGYYLEEKAGPIAIDPVDLLII